MNVVEKVKSFLKDHNIEFKYFKHEPTPTSEIASKVRGVPLSSGAKAMILKYKGKFCMCVLRADTKINFKSMKNILGASSVNFATADEVKKVTNCIPGGVPPFGNLFNIPVYCDKRLLENETINFNAGTQTQSISMKAEDWQKAVNPIVEDFAT